MASHLADNRRLPFRPGGLGLTSLALTGALAFAHEPPPRPSAGTCQDLPDEPRVSYKGREPPLFRRIVKRVESKPGRAPATPVVVRTFAACLDTARERVDAAEQPGAAGASTAGIRIEASGDWSTLRLTHGDSPARSYAARGGVVPLAKRLTRSLVGRFPRGRRDAVRNRLWFLWIESYLRATGQRYHSYDYASDLAEERAEERGRSFGVGFEVELSEGRPRVSAIGDERLRAAGLATGDSILDIDDRPVHRMTAPELQRYWLNPEPFAFTVTVLRNDDALRVRGRSVPTRHTTLAWSVRGETGYVRLRGFNHGSVLELRRARRAMEAASVRRLILDVRGNPGGTLAAGLVDLFFRPGQTVVSYRDHDAEDAVDVDATVEYWGIPAAVLVDRRTASMAEVLAAAFRAHDRGPVVGEKTLGKGVGQSVYPVLDEGRLRLVERTYYYPGTRETWNELGVTPTLLVELTDADEERLRPHLDSHVLQLDEQWEADPVLRAADRQMQEQR